MNERYRLRGATVEGLFIDGDERVDVTVDGHTVAIPVPESQIEDVKPFFERHAVPLRRTVNVEVYGDDSHENGVYGVATEHRPDLPDGLDGAIQEWVSENFEHFIDGDSVFYAAEMEYEPHGDVIGFRKKI